MNDNALLFTKALGLGEPWEVENINFENQELHITIKFKRGHEFKTKCCGLDTTAHDTIDKTWRHLNFFQFKTYIHCKVPRVRCKCGKINIVDVPWSRPECGFTMLFESFVLELVKNMSVLAVAKLVGEHDTKIWRILKYYVKKAVDNKKLENVKMIGVDETSVSGHNYITVFVNHDDKSVMYITDGKDSKTVDKAAEYLQNKNVDLSKIEVVTSDMSSAFKTGINKNFTEATIVYDKFHVMKLVNEALEKVRKRECLSNELLKKTKFLFLKRRENLKENQTPVLDKLLENEYLQTSIAYKLKLQFQEIYDSNYTKNEAKLRIHSWFDSIIKGNIKEMKNLARSIGNKLSNILTYFDYRYTNALLEGINSRIQHIKVRAKGFKNIENFKMMIYLCLGKLDLKII